MSCTNNPIDPDNINDEILVGPHESSTRIDRDSVFEVCAINFTCGITAPLIATNDVTVDNLTVNDQACLPIGEPGLCVSQPNDDYCETGGLHLNYYSSQTENDIGLDLQPTTQMADAFQLLDNWLKTFLVSQPPVFCFRERLSCELPNGSPDFLYVNWSLPPQRCFGFLPVNVPVINNVLIDFVKSSDNPNCDFTHPDTIHITAPADTTTFQAFTDNESGLLTDGSFTDSLGTTWRQYLYNGVNIIAGEQYDIRVYGKNYNCDHDFNYLIEKELCTLGIGIPTEPLNLTCGSEAIQSIGLNWDTPLDNNDLVTGNNSLPTLEQYQVNFETVSSVRYPNVLAHAGGGEPRYVSHPTTSTTVPNLNPGTTYEFTVQAKNVINSTGGTNSDGYGPPSNTIQCTTLLPNEPNELNSISLYTSGLIYPSGGWKLDCSVNYPNIYNWNLLDPTNSNINQQIRTNTVTNRQNNQVAGTTALLTSTLRAYTGLSDSLSSDYYLSNGVDKNLDGFGFTDAGNSYFSTGNVTELVLVKDEDFYTSGATDFQGFWKDWDGYVVAYDLGVTSDDTSAVFYADWDREYKIRLYQDHNDGTPKTKTPSDLTFVIDDINQVPTLQGCGIYDTVGGSVSNVTGIPTFSSSASFKYRFTMQQIARKFLRNDKKHATVALYLDDGTKISNDITIDATTAAGSTTPYYSPPGLSYQISATLHNTTGQVLLEDPGDIQFNDLTISMNATLAQEVCDDFEIRITPCNLFGVGTTDECGYLNETNGETKVLRIDTCSTFCLTGLDDSYGTDGLLVSSGSGQYPTISETGTHSAGNTVVGQTYNHELDLVSDLTEQLALLNGIWQNPQAIDYNTYYFPPGSIVPDMSGIVTDGSYRYVTFKFQRTPSEFDPSNPGSPDPLKTQNKVRLVINQPSGLTIDLTKVGAANHRLYLKVTGSNAVPGDGDPNTYDTYWMNATDLLGPNGLTNATVSTNDGGAPLFLPTNGEPNLEGATSTVAVRDCYVPTTVDNTAIFWVRIGWPNNVNYNFKCGISLYIIEGDFSANTLGLPPSHPNYSP